MKSNVHYMLSFLVLALVIIMLLSLGAQVIYGDYSKAQIEEKYFASFSAAQNHSDRRLESIIQYSQQLSDNFPIYMLNNGNGWTVNEALITTMLKNFERNSEWPVSLVFFQRSAPQSVLSSNGKLSYSEYEKSLREQGINIDFTDFFSSLLTVSSPTIRRPVSSCGKLLLYLPIGTAWSDYPATLLMLVDNSLISDCFNRDALGKESSLYALDSLGQLALSLPSDDIENLRPSELFDKNVSGITHSEFNGQKLVFLRQKSSTGIITYIAVVLEQSFYSSWFRMSRQLWYITAMTIIISVILSLILGHLISLPVRKAYQHVLGTKPTLYIDPLEEIITAYEKKNEVVSLLEEKQLSTVPMLRRQLVLGLINGTIKSENELDNYRQGMVLSLNHPWWFSMLLVPSLIPGETDKLLYALESISVDKAEILFAECRWEKGICLVINYDADDPHQAADKMAHALYAELCNYTADPLLLGCGSVETSPLSLGVSFYRSTSSVKAAMQENGVVIWSDEQPVASKLTLDTTLLAEGITYGNSEVAFKALDDLIARINTSQEHLPLVQLMCSDILSTVIRYAQKQLLPLDKARLSTIAEFHTIEEFHQRIGELIQDICAALGQMRMQESAQNHLRVITFITQNYMRNDLSLKLLSDEVNMSMSKINLVLKENLGCSFVQYVTLLRLNEVKRLLRETDDSIQTIIQSVGYIDVSSFMRKFKQTEGVSPGQYRSMNRK